ncbi:lasso peptide biosynthesis B2 protein [Aquibacillus rhizosphaerae]|uniref:Lasso peptide biosynthesis B2 protein n=1 Tax=Aquibacillus rhizosphaerae TaxID=3051431 RepID=A0ABT7L1B0_9BACI|nr:lasso peptide biosynthesis B2 protein [Aquibacillus sp. LR5S19]MDL4838972.1 lasso peptide biosynthesis B2 protein [Aquibacillus sp. LR5S19]
MNKVKKFLSLPLNRKILFLEAFFNLGWARILKGLPFTNVAKGLGVQAVETPNDAYSNPSMIRHISTTINIMSKYTVWESACLVQAIAAMRMLKRRGIESTLYLGTARDENHKMIAHAWVRSGPFYVTGAAERHRFTVVQTFASSVNKAQEEQKKKVLLNQSND